MEHCDPSTYLSVLFLPTLEGKMIKEELKNNYLKFLQKARKINRI